MLSRAKTWLKSRRGLSNAVQVSPSLTLLVPPMDGWDSANAAQTQRWIESIYAKQGAENTLLFCSSCSGLVEHEGLRAVFDDKTVQLGKESHFCPPQIAPEFKTTLALCRSVATWLQTEDGHVAVVAVSRQRAALIAVCIDTFLKPNHGCTSLQALDRHLARQFLAMCERIREKLPDCHPLRAHQFFLRNWARVFFDRAHPDMSPVEARASGSESRSNGGHAVVADQDEMLTAAEMVSGRRGSVLESPVVSGASPGRGPVRVKEVIISGVHVTPPERLVVMISQGEQLVFSSLNGSPPRQHGGGRRTGRAESASAPTRVIVGRVCSADADLVLRVYIMVDPTATGRASQRLVSSISFNVVFAVPVSGGGHQNGAAFSTGIGIASAGNGSGAGSGGDNDVATAVSPRREFTVTAADVDDADVPGSFHVKIIVTDGDEDEDDEDEGDGAPVDDVLIEPAGIAIPGAGSRGGGPGDDALMAYSLDDDAALALSLQRHFDLEAMAAGLPPSPHSPPAAATRDNSDGASIASGAVAEAGGDTRPRSSHGGEVEMVAGSAPAALLRELPSGGVSGSGSGSGSASASASGGRARAESESSGLASQQASNASTMSAEEQLATDEAFARALQEEFNRAATPQGRRRSSAASGGRRAAESGGDASPDALMRALQEDPVEFLRMVVEGGGAPGSRRRVSNAPHCVATLPTGTVTVAQLGNECQVCFETYTLGETFRILPCMHIYHKDCIDPWLLSKRVPTCPVCLTKVDQN